MTRKRSKPYSLLPNLLIISGLLVFAGVLLTGKEKSGPVEAPGDLPEIRLAEALDAGRPVFAFYHSDNCKSCLEMMALVEQVYPEFEATIVLVDVNVYDSKNQALLQDVGLLAIPTQIFYDRSGGRRVVLGLMQPEQLREAFDAISEGK